MGDYYVLKVKGQCPVTSASSLTSIVVLERGPRKTTLSIGCGSSCELKEKISKVSPNRVLKLNTWPTPRGLEVQRGIKAAQGRETDRKEA